MRYIGSKSNLLGEIRALVDLRSPISSSFCDLFAGTGAVGREFKKSHSIISNDILFFSYVMNAAYVGLKSRPQFESFRNLVGQDPIDFLNGNDLDVTDPTNRDFMFQHFSPEGSQPRQYLSAINALRIDRIRQSIETWHSAGTISGEEKLYLLCALIEEVPSVSNITGTYGAFLKHWDKRALKPISLSHLKIERTEATNRVFNMDANDLIRQISGDVLYMDTPYNGRQYSKNYHLLETLARYDYPEVKGVTGLRVDKNGDSDFCRKSTVYRSFDYLIQNAQFKTVVVSYSSDGLLNEEQLVEILTRHGNASSLTFKKIPYRRYKHTLNDDRQVLEYLIVIDK